MTVSAAAAAIQTRFNGVLAQTVDAAKGSVVPNAILWCFSFGDSVQSSLPAKETVFALLTDVGDMKELYTHLIDALLFSLILCFLFFWRKCFSYLRFCLRLLSLCLQFFFKILWTASVSFGVSEDSYHCVIHTDLPSEK